MTSLYHPHDPMHGVMGIMLIAVYETDDVNGGTKAPAWMRKTPTTRVPNSAHGDAAPRTAAKATGAGRPARRCGGTGAGEVFRP